MCTDQTSTQNDYIEQRDRCREYAQLKLDLAMRNSTLSDDDKSRKSQLVTLFSECMASNGWDVPAGKSGEKAAAAAVTPQAAAAAAATGTAPVAAGAAGGAAAGAMPLIPATTAPAPDKYAAKASLSRQTECAFARQAAANSTISAARAKACDLECSQRLQAAPESPRPAACPSEAPAQMSLGNERSTD